MGARTIVLDFETRSACNLRKAGAFRYSVDPTTQVLCMAWQWRDDPLETVHTWHRAHPWCNAEPFPEELADAVADGVLIEAHNAFFEWCIWNNTLRREFPRFPKLPLGQHRCTAARAAIVSLPRKLADLCAALQLKHRKDMAGHGVMLKLSKPRSYKDGALVWWEDEELHRRNWEYCAQDVRAEVEAGDRLPELSETELAYWLMDQRMNLRGVRLDEPSVHNAIKLLGKAQRELNGKLHQLTGGAVERSTQRVRFKNWVNDKNLFYLLNTQAVTFEEYLKPDYNDRWAELGAQGAAVKEAMTVALEANKASVAKYKQSTIQVCPDGRMRDLTLYAGASRTARWSGKGFQPHNMVKGYNSTAEMTEAWADINGGDAELLTLLWGSVVGCLSKAARGVLIPSAGCDFIVGDFKTVECRKLWWLAGEEAGLQLFRENLDPYIDMASAIYDRAINKKEHPNERQIGKTAVLGLGYQMGWEKFQAQVWRDTMKEGNPIWLPKDLCQRIVKVYRKIKYPKIPALWEDVDAAATLTVQTGQPHTTCTGKVEFYMANSRRLMCRLPSGRELVYWKPELIERLAWRFKALNEKNEEGSVTFTSGIRVNTMSARRRAEKLALDSKKKLMDDAPESRKRLSLTYFSFEDGRRIETYGGALVENIDQSSSRDLLAAAMRRVDEHDVLELVMSVHDEIISEAPRGKSSVEELEQLMCIVPPWASGMPIGAEGWRGDRYRK